jgi:hypothetical protein
VQELVGRLTSLDPEASETLKVITYFDHLVEGRVGVETMVRGAALLSGTVAGLTRGGRTIRIDPSGARLADAAAPRDPGGPAASGDSALWPKRDGGDGVVVWLERTGPAHANDAMVLERLAHSVLVSSAGTAVDGVARQPLEVLLDTGSALPDRERAAARLGLEPRTLLTVVARGGASAPGTPGGALASARMATAYGLVTASLVRGEPAATGVPTARCGVGTPVTLDHLSRSWSEALLALRVTTDREPSVRIEDLGLLAQAVEAADHASTPPADVAGVERAVAHGWSLEALESLADAESVRAVARAAGLHHSTLQARLADLPRHLGFDVATGRGRARLHTALIVRRAANARFG